MGDRGDIFQNKLILTFIVNVLLKINYQHTNAIKYYKEGSDG